MYILGPYRKIRDHSSIGTTAAISSPRQTNYHISHLFSANLHRRLVLATMVTAASIVSTRTTVGAIQPNHQKTVSTTTLFLGSSRQEYMASIHYVPSLRTPTTVRSFVSSLSSRSDSADEYDDGIVETSFNEASTIIQLRNNKAHKDLRGFFAGSGSDGISLAPMVDEILKLLPSHTLQKIEHNHNNMSAVNVLYVGTASYDLEVFREKQTKWFVKRGCTVESLNVAFDDKETPKQEYIAKLEAADVIVVGGGNTLFAMDRWRHLGLIPSFQAAMARECVMAGGSAGAICWFDSGHSDSADPDTYVTSRLEQYGSQENGGEDESSSYNAMEQKDWKYLRVPGLGMVPGGLICCPHHDRIQSNGVLRANDFDDMLLKRAAFVTDRQVRGIGIDHYAAFIVENGRYRVFSLPEKAGSVTEYHKEFAIDPVDGTANGIPGVWIKTVVIDENKQMNVDATVCPPEGRLIDLLGDGVFYDEDYHGDYIEGMAFDEPPNHPNALALKQCRFENPSVSKQLRLST